MKNLQVFFLLLFAVAAQSQTVYKTPSGAKYHLENCRTVNNVSKAISISDALKLGLAPCKICKPPLVQKTSTIASKSAKGTAKTVQCKGNTKKGTRCKHRTSIGNGYCFQHNPDK
ncbi:DUF5763 domain-containing protein [Flavobacterium tegetincola]|uniref:DUF5763 domain-containing protein n=1 Tax=Flavobacterium tegetincola TaxID=150172 RepID=UPI00040A72FF|nr:DUF5763 domain-containing protein [Flavobacterium tegetincola]